MFSKFQTIVEYREREWVDVIPSDGEIRRSDNEPGVCPQKCIESLHFHLTLNLRILEDMRTCLAIGWYTHYCNVHKGGVIRLSAIKSSHSCSCGQITCWNKRFPALPPAAKNSCCLTSQVCVNVVQSASEDSRIGEASDFLKVYIQLSGFVCQGFGMTKLRQYRLISGLWQKS